MIEFLLPFGLGVRLRQLQRQTDGVTHSSVYDGTPGCGELLQLLGFVGLILFRNVLNRGVKSLPIPAFKLPPYWSRGAMRKFPRSYMRLRLLAVTSVLTANFGVSHAQTAAALPLLQAQPATEQSSYEAGLKRRGVRDADPNVYVYTPEFAKRFQLPMQWASEELKGADAVAFRVMPTYKTCGWGGDPSACREDEVRCDMDVYFNHKKNPLPWDDRMHATEMDRSMTSQWFIGNVANPLARPQSPLIGGPIPRGPFTDPKSGKELGWQDWHGGSVGGWLGTRAYDREIFAGISLVTFGASCTSPALELWLASEGLSKRDVPGSQSLKQLVILPLTWQLRVKQALTDSDQRSKSFFRQQGEKALKALQAQPAVSKPAAPIQ